MGFFNAFVERIKLFISIPKLRKQKEDLQTEIAKLESLDKETSSMIKVKLNEYDELLESYKSKSIELDEKYNEKSAYLKERHSKELADLQKKYDAESAKYLKFQVAYSSVLFAIENFDKTNIEMQKLPSEQEIEELLSPTVILHSHTQDIRSLKTKARDIRKQIDRVVKSYENRYTTKIAKAMYQFMTIALEAELQNILYNLKYDKLDKNLLALKDIINKFEVIASEGNQSIAPTLRKFLLQMESLFEQLIKIEYEYYVQKERIKEEQKILKEQMKQEAAERQELERQQKQLDKERSKYETQIDELKARAAIETDDSKTDKISKRIAELEAEVAVLDEKKEKIVNLSTGKAGYVYVISNLGSFGKNVFKVGMTRRLEPQDRIDELGNASVPFEFDVHSFIFSNDAVALEAALHADLDDKRVNKVNLRKEFFRVSMDEIEQLVYEHEPSASFTRTMLAEQYRQTKAIEQNIIEFDSSEQQEDIEK